MTSTLQEQLQAGFSGSMSGINQRAPNIPFPAPEGFVEAPTVEPETEVTEESIVEMIEQEQQVDKVTDVVKEVKMENSEQPKRNSYRKIISDRLDGKSKKGFRVKGITNSALSSLLTQFTGDGVSEEVTIGSVFEVDVEYVRVTGTFCIWEEGGAEFNRGSVLIVTDKDGDKKQADIAYHDDNTRNGKHARVEVEVGDIVLLGVSIPNGDNVLVACEIKEFTNSESPKAICESKAVFQNDSRKMFSYESEDFVITVDHPCVVAATKRMLNDQLTTTPCWIRDWTIHRFVKQDFESTVIEMQPKIVWYNNLEEAYKTISDALRVHVKDSTRTQHVLCTTELDVNNTDENGNPAVFVFMAGVIYDTIKRSSEGNRIIYGCVIIRPGDEFYYIDSPETKYKFEDVEAFLKSREKYSDGKTFIPVGTSCWRMTE